MWLRGRGPLSSLAGLEISDAKTSGMSRTELFRVPHRKPVFPANAWQLDVLVHRVQVPKKETTYWCRLHKLPTMLKQKYVYILLSFFYIIDNVKVIHTIRLHRHHILQFGPSIQAGNEHLVHHMEVFHCVGPPEVEMPMYDGPCDGADRPEKTQVSFT